VSLLKEMLATGRRIYLPRVERALVLEVCPSTN